MAFKAERNRLEKHLLPAEDILASDVVLVTGESPRIGLVSPVLIATNRAIYLAEGSHVSVIPYGDLEAVQRKRGERGQVPAEIQLVGRESIVLTLAYSRRAKAQPTADAITERFFGRVIPDTTDVADLQNLMAEHVDQVGRAL